MLICLRAGTPLPTTPNIVGCYMLRPFARPVACCWMFLRVVAQSLKPVKLFGQQLPTFLLFRDRRSVAQQVGSVRTALPTLLGPRITHGLQRLRGCILSTMHCRSQHCWELLHPFAHHCQHARNNSHYLEVVAPVCTQPKLKRVQRWRVSWIRSIMTASKQMSVDHC